MASAPNPENKAGHLTHRQIAEQLGVSRQLVGFALRGDGRMSDETRQRILEVARSSGYDQYSNGAARSMAARRHGKRSPTGVLAVLFEATYDGQPLSSVPFFMPFFEGLESEAIERGFDLVLCARRPHGLPRLVRDGLVDGVVLLETDEIAIEPLLELGLPLVRILLAVKQPTIDRQTPALGIDTRQGCELATRHLIELGHRRIAYLGFPPPDGGSGPRENQKLAGYRAALRQAQLPIKDNLVELSLQSTSIQAGTEAMQRLLGGRPPDFTGLVCFNDLVAMGAIRALEAGGYSVPADVSVVGFDDVSAQYAFHPVLSSIYFPREAMGRRAVQLLCDPETRAAMQQHQVFPVDLVQRASTSPPPPVQSSNLS